MISVYKDKTDCCGCESCRQACPNQCISMVQDSKGFLYPMIDQTRCIDCQLCLKSCPLSSEVEKLPNENCFVYLHSHENHRLMSSSSGAFEPLCKAFSENGKDIVVFGCEMNENLKVVHGYSINFEGFDKFKKSKYLQSKIGDSYKLVKTYLLEGCKVVFSGTPCQVYGLKKFLKKDYENLLTVDLLCHGVPSQSVFDDYLHSLRLRFGKRVIAYSFRHKEIYNGGWQNLSIKVDFKDGTSSSLNCSEDMYMVGFLKGLFNRDCCYDCKFASTSRCSDITLGDFWGISEYNADYDERKTNGTSLVIASTEKGKKLVSSLPDSIIEEISLKYAIPHNGQLIAPQNLHPKRELFFRKNKGYFGFVAAMCACYPEKFSVRNILLNRLYAMTWYKSISVLKNKLLN